MNVEEKIRRNDFTTDCERVFHKLDALMIHLKTIKEDVEGDMDEIRNGWNEVKEHLGDSFDEYLINRIPRELLRTTHRIDCFQLNDIVAFPTLQSCIGYLEELIEFTINAKKVIDESHETLNKYRNKKVIEADHFLMISYQSQGLIDKVRQILDAAREDLKHTSQYYNETKEHNLESEIIAQGNLVNTTGYSYRSFFGPLIDEQNAIEIYFKKRIAPNEFGEHEIIEILSVNNCSDILLFKTKLKTIIQDCLKKLSNALPRIKEGERIELLEHMKGGLNESLYLFVTEEYQMSYLGGARFTAFKCLRNPKIKGEVPDDEVDRYRTDVLSEASNYAKEVEEIILWTIRRVDYLIDQIEFGSSNEIIDKRMDNKEPHSVFSNVTKTQVFIVHGHDELAKTEVARYIEKLGFKPIILHEQASSGRTIIEKIEEYSNVGFGIVLYTPCDIGGKKGEDALKDRARQNVVFEHGYLIGKIGRPNVCALVKGNIETPNDISGVVYVAMDKDWHFKIAKELRESGYVVDMNRLA